MPDPGLPPPSEVWRREYLTCPEAAGLSRTAASTWRARCAAGLVPGAINVSGRQWLIPRSLVESNNQKLFDIGTNNDQRGIFLAGHWYSAEQALELLELLKENEEWLKS